MMDKSKQVIAPVQPPSKTGLKSFNGLGEIIYFDYRLYCEVDLKQIAPSLTTPTCHF